MRRRTQAWILFLGAAAVALMAGCAGNTTFVYKPEAPAAGAPKLSARAAVLPFKDGTEDFRDRGSVFSSGQYNLAKAGLTGTITAITPDLWAKSFADDLVASGAFPAARFIYSASELADEEYLFEGVVNKAYWGKTFNDTNELALVVSASRRADKEVVWQKEVGRAWKTPGDIYKGCGMGVQCMVDRLHGELNTALRAMFAEARADLLATIGSLPASAAGRDALRAAAPAAGEAAGTNPPASQSPESADQTIDRILNEK